MGKTASILKPGERTIKPACGHGDELGIEPWPDITDLEERILLHDPALTAFETAPEPITDDIDYVNFGPGEVIVEQGAQASAIYWIE